MSKDIQALIKGIVTAVLITTGITIIAKTNDPFWLDVLGVFCLLVGLDWRYETRE